MSSSIVKGGEVGSFASLLLPVPPKEVLTKMARTDAEIEQIKTDAFAASFDEGKSAGFLAGVEEGKPEGERLAYEEAMRLHQAELDAFHEALAQTIEKIEGAMAEWYAKSEPKLAQLAVLIAERIVASELKTAPETIVQMTKETVAEITHSTSARIRVSPFDSELLDAHRQEILAASASLRELEIVDDPDILGGCVIESEGGVVDGTIDMKFREILDRIREAA